jgi:hypothetical protein
MKLVEAPAERRPLWVRLAWMILIWAASIAALGALAAVIRLWLRA